MSSFMTIQMNIWGTIKINLLQITATTARISRGHFRVIIFSIWDDRWKFIMYYKKLNIILLQRFNLEN